MRGCTHSRALAKLPAVISSVSGKARSTARLSQLTLARWSSTPRVRAGGGAAARASSPLMVPPLAAPCATVFAPLPRGRAATLGGAAAHAVQALAGIGWRYGQAAATVGDAQDDGFGAGRPVHREQPSPGMCERVADEFGQHPFQRVAL